MSNRRPNQNFDEFGWKVGDILVFQRTQTMVSIAGSKTVWYRGKEVYLTNVAEDLGIHRATGVVNTRTGEKLQEVYDNLHPIAA